MFGLFKKKSKVEILNSKYKKLQEQAFKWSTSSRAQSDQKYVEAEEVLKEIEAIQKAGTD